MKPGMKMRMTVVVAARAVEVGGHEGREMVML